MPSPEGQNVPRSQLQADLRELNVMPFVTAETQHTTPEGEMITTPASVKEALAASALGGTVRGPENSSYVREVVTIPEDKVTTEMRAHAVNSPFKPLTQF